MSSTEFHQQKYCKRQSLPASWLKSSSCGASLHHSSIIGLKLYCGSAHAIQSTMDFASFKSCKKKKKGMQNNHKDWNICFPMQHLKSQTPKSFQTSNMIFLMSSCWTLTTTFCPSINVARWTCAICIEYNMRTTRLFQNVNTLCEQENQNFNPKWASALTS